jgi:hypothetical protein
MSGILMLTTSLRLNDVLSQVPPENKMEDQKDEEKIVPTTAQVIILDDSQFEEFNRFEGLDDVFNEIIGDCEKQLEKFYDEFIKRTSEKSSIDKEHLLQAKFEAKNKFRYQIKLSLVHLIKECLEVISWLPVSENEYSIIYYDDLSSCIRFVAEKIKGINAKYYPQNSFNFKISTYKEISEKVSLDKTEMTNDDLLEVSDNTKAFIPISYGFRSPDLHKIIQ